MAGQPKPKRVSRAKPEQPQPSKQEFVEAPRARLSDEDREAQLDQVFLTAFSTPTGQEVLKVLKFQFIHSILGPTSTDQELRFREGARYVIGVIGERMGRADHANRTKAR